MIRLVNLRGYKRNDDEVLIRVDRSSVLGNPFYLKHERYRSNVCNEYDVYFEDKILSKDADFINELERIKEISKSNDVALGCWCFPIRCHADIILRYLLKEG